MDAKVEKINELLLDEEFVKNIVGCETLAEVQVLFEENGVGLSIDEVEELGQKISKKMNNSGELGEDDLEMVSGGAGDSTISNISSEALDNVAGTASVAVTKGITITKVRNCEWIKKYL